MPHGSIWFPEPEYDREGIIMFMGKLARIAETLGYSTSGGPKAGRGNIRRLLEAIVWGEVCVRPCTDNENELDTDSPGAPKAKTAQIEHLKGEMHHLENIQELLRDIRRGGGRGVWCCTVDHLPHTGGYCPLHPEAERETVREAIKALDIELSEIIDQLLDLET